jgi:hypothetical protein
MSLGREAGGGRVRLFSLRRTSAARRRRRSSDDCFFPSIDKSINRVETTMGQLNLQRWMVGALATVVFAAMLAVPAAADLRIPTNNGGADAEVREEEVGLDGSGVPQGVNRGANSEIATRIRDTTNGTPTGDRTSAIYLRFNVAGVTPADLATSDVSLELTIRNTNVVESRRNDFSPMFPGEDAHRVTQQFNLFGLNNFAHSNYDWAENAITWYNAPGITPDDPGGTSGDGVDTNDSGKFNFNNDLGLLGTFGLPVVAPQNHLAVGSKVTFSDTLGRLHDLIEDAKAQGKSSITLVVATALDGFDATAAESELIQSTPQGMLNFNYLFNPKEQTVLTDDPGYDADSGGPIATTGSPFSCNGGSSPNCPLGTLGDNSGGAFSPALVLTTRAVPEPAGIVFALMPIFCFSATRQRRWRF